jgi:hypothetical protein
MRAPHTADERPYRKDPLTTPTLMTDLVHKLHLRQLRRFLNDRAEIRAEEYQRWLDRCADWDFGSVPAVYHTRQRDADTWCSFNRVRLHAKELLDVAQHQLQHLPDDAVKPWWAGALASLGEALGQIDGLQREWIEIREVLSPGAVPGTDEYDEEISVRNHAAWPWLSVWSDYGRTILTINTTANPAGSRKASAPVTTPAPVTERATTVRR